MRVDHGVARSAFLEQLDGFVGEAGRLTDAELTVATRCAGWTAADLVVHVHLGLQEMLLGLVAPTDRPADTDASSYWQSQPPIDGEDPDRLDGMRFVRLVGAAYRRPTGSVRHLLPTVAGVRSATLALRPGMVSFQGHVLATGDFLATWAVELAVHHLDLGRELAIAPPARAGLTLARRTVEALAGGPLPSDWPDDEVVLLGTGRTRPSPQHRAAAPLVETFPVLG